MDEVSTPGQVVVGESEGEEDDELLAEPPAVDQPSIIFAPKLLVAEDSVAPALVVDATNVALPTLYRSNSRQEDLILTYIENFRRQYHHIYRNRKPLLLSPINEFGVAKFVCTTIRPTMLPYSELTDWKLAADFLADHLNYDRLDPVHELPRMLCSSTRTLAEQHGNCFDYAHLLCSLLLGAGYDAYVVSGYASREICYMDTSRLSNPYPRAQQQRQDSVELLRSGCQKYLVKSAKDFTSQYDAYMKQRHLDAIQADKDRMQEEENRRIEAIEKPPYDPLCGVRVHAWVLVLPGKRDVSTAFYIESTTGYGKATTDRDYLGIESVWNNQNLWVNMQDCSDGCESLQFYLSDQTRWECVFPHLASETDLGTVSTEDDEAKLVRKRSAGITSSPVDWLDRTKFYFSNPLDLPVSNVNALSYYQRYPEGIKAEIYRRYYKSVIPNIRSEEALPSDFAMPLSWVGPLDISPQNFHKRYPNAHKRYFFRKTCVDKYAPYSMKDGIVLRVSEYDDYGCEYDARSFRSPDNPVEEVIYVTYYYEHRFDKLNIREHNVQANTVHEQYRPGRGDHLKEYIYNFDPAYNHTMIYYSKSRLDCLSERHETPVEFIEHYTDHEHFLASRKVVFEPILGKIPTSQRESRRPILSITEAFNRNVSIEPNDDIQELHYAIRDNKFIITYHRDDRCISPSIRTFIKPPNWNDKAFAFKWQDDLERTFQADEEFKSVSTRDLYLHMKQLIEQETVAIKRVRNAEAEIKELQSHRQQEELASDLEVSIYDTDRNKRSRMYRDFLEQKPPAKENTDDVDYLAPSLIARGHPERIDAQIAEQLRHSVLLNFKNRSVQRANTIQSHYESELAALTHTSRESDCEQVKFRLEVLQQRLKQHRESSRREYIALQQKLRDDARLREPYVVR